MWSVAGSSDASALFMDDKVLARYTAGTVGHTPIEQCFGAMADSRYRRILALVWVEFFAHPQTSLTVTCWRSGCIWKRHGKRRLLRHLPPLMQCQRETKIGHKAGTAKLAKAKQRFQHNSSISLANVFVLLLLLAKCKEQHGVIVKG